MNAAPTPLLGSLKDNGTITAAQASIGPGLTDPAVSARLSRRLDLAATPIP